MALQIVTVADSISKLTVTGATMKDIDEIPETTDMMDVPMIIPKPDGYLSGFRMLRVGLGPGTSAAINVAYTLTYRLLHSEVGEGMDGIFSTYSAMVAIVGVFLDAIIANDTITGAVDLQAASITEFGLVYDSTGKVAFHGCDIGIEILEFVN